MKNLKVKLYSFIAILLSFVLVFSSCGKKEKQNSDSSGSSSSSSTSGSYSDESTVPSESEGSKTSEGESSDSESTSKNSTTKASTTKPTTQTNNPGKAKTLYIKDFGAVGDGKTDDASAIFVALGELQNSPSGSKLIFEKNKTYYARNNGTGLTYIFNISDFNNVTIDGNGSTLLLGDGKSYMSIFESQNVTVQNFNFDYKTKPAFKATAQSVSTSDSTAILVADRDIGLGSGESYAAPISLFGVLEKPNSRYHMYITKIEMIDASARKIKVYFDRSFPNTVAWVSQLNSVPLICPMPKIGHLIERGFTIQGNTNFTMKNCNIYSVARFGMLVHSNEGTVLFDNVNFTPANNNLDKNMDFTGWRDGYHCKENRAKIIWNNCDASGLYDDVINISASTMNVKEYKAAQNQVNLYWGETGGTYAKIKSGDEITFINTTTGKMIGRTKVARVVSQSGSNNIITLQSKLSGLAAGENILAFFDSQVAPNSEIKNCNFDGTFRFRGPLTVTNTTMNVRRMWIDLYGVLEGPLPRNILFKNSTLKTESASGKYFHIGAGSSASGSDAYHVENIRFENCVLNRSNFDISPADIKYVSFS